jgi:dienelactone hydrolase
MNAKMSKLRRRLLAISLTLLLLILCIHTGSWIYCQRDYSTHFKSQKGEITSVREAPLALQSGSALAEIELLNDRGLTVRGYISVPTSRNGPFPVLLMLGGLRTGKHVLDYIGEMENAILLALDYPYEGKKSKMGVGEFLSNLPSMRQAVMNTVPAVLLAIDYLIARDDVDADRITLIGGSVGALFSPAIAASDQRITAVAILFGAGDVQSLIKANIDMRTPVPSIAAWLGGTLISPLEPLKYVDRISPRPLFMLNGTGDPRMPEHCSRRLHEKAKNPKTIHWIPAGHIHIRDNEFHNKVRVLLEEWLKENRLILTESTGF